MSPHALHCTLLSWIWGHEAMSSLKYPIRVCSCQLRQSYLSIVEYLGFLSLWRKWVLSTFSTPIPSISIRFSRKATWTMWSHSSFHWQTFLSRFPNLVAYLELALSSLAKSYNPI